MKQIFAAKLTQVVLPFVLCLSFSSIQAMEKDSAQSDLLSSIENHETADQTLRCKRNKQCKNAYGSFYNEDEQVVLSTEQGTRDTQKIAFPNTSASNCIKKKNGGKLFVIQKSGVYQITVDLTLGAGSTGIGPVALDIDQKEKPVPGSQFFIDGVALDSFSRTVQVHLKKGQTIDVNYFGSSGTRLVLEEANINFLLIN